MATDLQIKSLRDILNSLVVQDSVTKEWSLDLSGTKVGERGKFKKIEDLFNAIVIVSRVDISDLESDLKGDLSLFGTADATYTVSGLTKGRSLDASETTLDMLATVVGTLIEDLKSIDLIK